MTGTFPSADEQRQVLEIVEPALQAVSLRRARLTIEQAVASGGLDALVSEQRLSEWLAWAERLPGPQGPPTVRAFVHLCIVWAIHFQTLRLRSADREPTAVLQRGESWATAARAFAAVDDLDTAAACYANAAAEFEQADDPWQVGIYVAWQATLLVSLNRGEEALSLFEQAARLLAPFDRREAARCVMNQALCVAQVGRWTEALPLIQTALASFGALGMDSDVALAMANEAACFQNLGRFEEGLELSRQAAQLLESGEPRHLAGCLVTEGLCLALLERNAEALPLFQRAHPTLESVGATAESVRCAGHEADCLLQLGRPTEALPLYEQVIAADPAHVPPAEHGVYLLNYADALRESGRLQDARAMYRQARPILRAHVDPGTAGLSLMNEAVCVFMLGDPSTALRMLRSAAGRLREPKQAVNHARCLANEAACLAKLGRPEQAVALLHRARRETPPDATPHQTAVYLIIVATALVDARRAQEALALYDQARALLETHGHEGELGVCLNNEARCLERLGRPDEALNLFRRARAILERTGPPTEYALCLLNEAFTSTLPDDEAIRLFELALEASAPIGPVADEIRWRAHYGLATRFRYQLHQQPEFAARAAAEISAAIEVVERSAGAVGVLEDRLSLRATYSEVFRTAVQLALDAGEVEVAFGRAQQAKARIVAELLPGQAEPNADGLDRGVPRSLAAIQSCLRDDEALIDLLTIPDGLACFVVTRRRLIGRKPFHDALRGAFLFRPMLALLEDELAMALALQRERIEALATWREVLIGELEADHVLEGIANLIISPSRSLYRLPFAAFWRQDAESMRYLADDYVLSLIPSATALWQLRQRPDVCVTPTFLGIAPFAADADVSATRGRETYPDLPETGREAEAVAQLVRAINAQAEAAIVLTGEQATRAAVLDQARRARLLLVATHGIAGEDLAAFRLLLGSHGRRRTDLRIVEVYEGRLALQDTIQVALTSCHLGDVVQDGDEAAGFVQAFLSAGARLIVAPTRQVDDGAAAELSIAYHTALLDPTQPARAGEAMRSAMRHVRSMPGWQHPYFWASALPTGDASIRMPMLSS
jgi:tetratricopeptide (TPR) repeat protein/CHAT domain-containing protein